MSYKTTEKDILKAIDSVFSTDDVRLLVLVRQIMRDGMQLLDVVTDPDPMQGPTPAELEWFESAIKPEMDLYAWSVLPKPATPGWRKAYLLWLTCAYRAIWRARLAADCSIAAPGTLGMNTIALYESLSLDLKGITWTVHGPELDRNAIFGESLYA
jgi:hypothetical protein